MIDGTLTPTNFVQNLLVKKVRDRSKSKESSRRDSSESRLSSLADFFRSPSGSRKSSLGNSNNNHNNSENNSTVTIRVTDSDGLESSPENSVRMSSVSSLRPSGHHRKSRLSKSPLRVLCKLRPWGSRDTLDGDDKISSTGGGTVKIEYNALQESVSLSSMSTGSYGRFTTPSFLAVNSREGVDFENLESSFGVALDQQDAAGDENSESLRMAEGDESDEGWELVRDFRK